MAQAGPEIPVWQDTYGEDGLIAMGISIQESLAVAAEYWDQYPHEYYMADQSFSTGQFFPGPMVGTPAYIVVDLSTMQIINIQEGYSGAEEGLFTPYLR